MDQTNGSSGPPEPHRTFDLGSRDTLDVREDIFDEGPLPSPSPLGFEAKDELYSLDTHVSTNTSLGCQTGQWTSSRPNYDKSISSRCHGP